MADAPNTPTYTTPQTGQTRTKLFKWVLNGVSKGKAVLAADWSDKTFQVTSLAHGGATTILAGCNEERGNPDHPDYANAIFTTLTDTTETPISATIDQPVVQVLQNPVWIRPETSGGTASVINAFLGVTKQ